MFSICVFNSLFCHFESIFNFSFFHVFFIFCFRKLFEVWELEGGRYYPPPPTKPPTPVLLLLLPLPPPVETGVGGSNNAPFACLSCARCARARSRLMPPWYGARLSRLGYFFLQCFCCLAFVRAQLLLDRFFCHVEFHGHEVALVVQVALRKMLPASPQYQPLEPVHVRHVAWLCSCSEAASDVDEFSPIPFICVVPSEVGHGWSRTQLWLMWKSIPSSASSDLWGSVLVERSRPRVEGRIKKFPCYLQNFKKLNLRMFKSSLRLNLQVGNGRDEGDEGGV